MDTHGDFRQVIYAPRRVCGGPHKPGGAGVGKARHARGPPIIRLAPPCDHGAALEPAAGPTCTGPPFRGPVPLLGKVTPRVKEQQAREIAGQLRQSMPPCPRGTPQARPVHPPPHVTVTLPSPQPDRSATHGRRGRGRGGRGRGHNTPSTAGAPGRGGLPPPGIPPRLGSLHGRRLRTHMRRLCS